MGLKFNQMIHFTNLQKGVSGFKTNHENNNGLGFALMFFPSVKIPPPRSLYIASSYFILEENNTFSEH